MQHLEQLIHFPDCAFVCICVYNIVEQTSTLIIIILLLWDKKGEIWES